MKPKLSPNYPSVPFLLYTIFGGALLLALGVYGIFVTYEGLKSGQVYSPAIILGIKTAIYRTGSPVAYWVVIAIYVFSCMAGLCLGLLAPIETMAAYRKKRARQEAERELR